MKKSTILLIVFFAVILVFSIIKTINQPPVKKKNKFTRTIPGEYLDLFSPEAKKQFESEASGTITMPSGLSVSSTLYIYLQKSGNASGNNIEIFKVGIKGDKPLDEVIQINKTDKDENFDKSFTTLREGGFDFKYKDGKLDSVSKVIWNFKGDVLNLNRKQVDLMYYDVQFENFSLKYDNGSELLANKTGLSFLHATGKFIFLKRGHNLYTIFISDADVTPQIKDTVLTLLNHDLIK